METYDVVVIGTGAGGGMAIKTLCEAGLKVCALNAGRQANPAKDFREHRMPYDLKFRRFWLARAARHQCRVHGQ